MADKNTVDKPSAEVAEDEAKHHLAYALRDGTGRMRELAMEGMYMRPQPGELQFVEEPATSGAEGGVAETMEFSYNLNGITQKFRALSAAGGRGGLTFYQARVERSSMNNVWADSIRNTAKLPFRSRIDFEGWDEELVGKDIVNEEGRLSDRIPGWIDNVDGNGSTFQEFAAKAFEDSLFAGLVFGFVDNDPREFSSPADRKAAGAQPYVTKLLREDIRRIVVSIDETGRPKLELVSFRQPKNDADLADPNNWEEEEIDAYKVVRAPQRDEEGNLGAVTCVLYERQEDDTFKPTDTTEIQSVDPNNPLTEIPLVPLYANRVAPWRGECPYLETTYLQQTIWNLSSEIDNKARETCLAYVHESGVASESEGDNTRAAITNGRHLRYHWSSAPNAKLTIAEQSGDSLNALSDFLEGREKQVKESHNQIHSDRQTGPVTAREITIEGVHASSALEMMICLHEAGWNRILHFMALLGGLQKRGKCSIPKDFGLPNSGIERNAELFKVGKMHPRNYYNEARRAGDVHETEFDIELEVESYEEDRELAQRDPVAELAGALNETAQPPAEPDEDDDADAS